MNNDNVLQLPIDVSVEYVPVVLCLIATDGLVYEFEGIPRNENGDLYRVYDSLLGLDDPSQVYNAVIHDASSKAASIASRFIGKIDYSKVYETIEAACDIFMSESFFMTFLANGRKLLSLLRRSNFLSKALPALTGIGLVIQTLECVDSMKKLSELKAYFKMFGLKESGYHINKAYGLFSDPNPVVETNVYNGKWIHVDYNLDGRIFLCGEFLNGYDCMYLLRQFGASGNNWFSYSESIKHGPKMAAEILKYVIKNQAHKRFKEYCNSFDCNLVN